MDGNVRHYILEVIFHNKAENWKADKNDDVRIG